MSGEAIQIGVKSPAKLNLTFDITGALPNGYHAVETLMCAIGLEDELHFDIYPADEFSVEIAAIESQSAAVPHDSSNLIIKAALLLRDSCPSQLNYKVSCRLNKRIPVAGGMGGGSGNAAATLVALNQILSSRLTAAQLAQLASTLGADVAFFLKGGIQIGRGKGDKLSQVEARPHLWFVVISPKGLSLSTPKIYADYDAFEDAASLKRPQLNQTLQALHSSSSATACSDTYVNVFTPVVFKNNPQLAALAKTIGSLTGQKVHMTGSGPTLFICVDNAEHAERLRQAVLAKVNESSSDHDALSVSAWTAPLVPHGVEITESLASNA
jgi:4-diphosphocytidyl-2-C-methyl-D-erythritol kinase